MIETTPPIAYSEWTEWRPEEYLSEYYEEVMADERFAMEFLIGAAKNLNPVPLALDFGCGPTVHHLFPLVSKVQEFHVAEYLESNRNEVARWVRGENSHSWREFAAETLRMEGANNPSDEDAVRRENEARTRLTEIFPADAGDLDPLGIEKRGFYPLVTTHYCAEGATSDKETWSRYMTNICSLVKPGGSLILSACTAANYYCIGERHFPCAGISPCDVLESLRYNGFVEIDLRVRPVPDHTEQGYSSVIFANAVKSAS